MGSQAGRGNATRGFLLGVHGHLQRLSVPALLHHLSASTTHLTWSNPNIDGEAALPVTPAVRPATHAGSRPAGTAPTTSNRPHDHGRPARNTPLPEGGTKAEGRNDWINWDGWCLIVPKDRSCHLGCFPGDGPPVP